MAHIASIKRYELKGISKFVDDLINDCRVGGHDAKLPGIALVDPPCLGARCECEVEIRLQHEFQGGEGRLVIVGGGGVTVASVPLTDVTGRTVRVLLPPQEAGPLTVGVEGSLSEAAYATLLVLPSDACRDVEEIFVLMADAIREEASPLRSGTADARESLILESAWRDYFQPFATDLGGLLQVLAAKGQLSPRDSNLLHSQLVYMLQNCAWALAAYFLRACLSYGIPIKIGSCQFSEEDVDPAVLRRLAQEFE
ncbi:unnamed protein product [Ostreobium quekettii]|uniref:Uncharacterized protein n=1 Tax=Ostreobium quekettii TaxID=121088 RepID=A0A8S1IN31_9CHLO|nr:unnamed protein product [Ostreobium quekettii]|eukprot:evm.model.scf_367.2 EVM.evm.TU.scf_367.2   scf_367:25994-28271(+)